MKAKKIAKEQEFTPITVEITIQSQKELSSLQNVGKSIVSGESYLICDNKWCSISEEKHALSMLKNIAECL